VDLYLLLVPVLVLPVVWLLRFTGCASFSEADETTGDGVPVKRINCGGPAVPADPAKGETLGWEADSATVGTAGFGELGRPKVTDLNGAPAGEIYETWRIGPSGAAGLPYVLVLDEGDYKVVLKFARLDSNVNVGGNFLVQFKNDPPLPIDASISVHPLSRQFDYPAQAVHVDSSKQLKITFLVNQQLGGGTFPFINAIEVRR
jgi:hypothetical protein